MSALCAGLSAESAWAETARYSNAEYGFRFSAPPGLALVRPSAPAPNHGAEVRLGSGRRIDVSAAFDAAGYGSTQALLDARLPRAGATGLHRESASLGGRVAAAAGWRSGDAVHALVVRHEGAADAGVNYTVELTSTAAHAGADRAAFGRVLASFRFTPRS